MPKKRPPKKAESMRVSVTPAQRAAIKALADERDVSEAHVVRQAIRFYLESLEVKEEKS